MDQPVKATDATFDAVVNGSALPVLVDFWAPWCVPCRRVAPELEKVARQHSGEVLIAKLNTERNPTISSRYEIRSIPALVVFEHGREVARRLGVMPAQEIGRLIPNT